MCIFRAGCCSAQKKWVREGSKGGGGGACTGWYKGVRAVQPESVAGESCIGITLHITGGARCSSVVRAFAHGAMGRQIDPSWGGPIEVFDVPASAPRLV